MLPVHIILFGVLLVFVSLLCASGVPCHALTRHDDVPGGVARGCNSTSWDGDAPGRRVEVGLRMISRSSRCG